LSTTEIIVRAGSGTAVSQVVYQTVLNQALLIAGPPGPVGPPGGAVPTLAFSYGDATPELVATLLAGQRLVEVRLSVETAFNGSGARLSVGTTADHNAFADESVVDPTTAAVFEFSPQTVFLVDTPVYLFITPGSGASAGKGSVILQRQ
jgi:hypothetical protein